MAIDRAAKKRRERRFSDFLHLNFIFPLDQNKN